MGVNKALRSGGYICLKVESEEDAMCYLLSALYGRPGHYSVRGSPKGQNVN